MSTPTSINAGLPSDLSFRPATEEDFPSILDIERKSYPLPWPEQALREELSKPYSNFLVLTDDETDSIVMGYMVYWLMFEECHILNIAVAEQWRGLGLAKRMVHHIINHALKKEAKKLYLEVRKSNKRAIDLYQKMGFFIDHIKPQHYQDSEDAYHMVRFLQEKSDF